MTRKVTEYVVDADNRDKGATFILTEMSADRGASWAYRLLFLLLNSGGVISDDMLHSGFAGVAAVGRMLGELKDAIEKLPYEKIQPLLDELMACVKWQPEDRRLAAQAIMRGDNCQIQEISTFFKLHWAVLELHTGFSLADATQTLD